jgi:formylglycine-generating enzyme required for sulfatase activity
LTNKYNTKGQRSLFGVNRLCETNNSIKFAFVPSGTFVMGSREDEPEELNRSKYEKPWHNVTITKDYYVGIYKLTQAEWKRVVELSAPIDLNATPSCNNLQNSTLIKFSDGEANPVYSNVGCAYTDSVFANGTGTHPVETVSWTDAQKFVNALNILEPNITIDGERYKYALPTEAQWERAIRADSTTSWYWGQDWCGANSWNSLNECYFKETLTRAWFIPRLNYNNELTKYYPNDVVRIQPVGLKLPTAYGLYDMGSNLVPEWIEDYYDAEFYSKPEALLDDPVNDTYRNDVYCVGRGQGYERVVRGSYGYAGWGLRSAFRQSQCEGNVPSDGASTSNLRVGFRLALVRAE